MAPKQDPELQASALAASIDCLTEAELQVLAGVEKTTLETWRKRGTGPDYVRLGTRYLYPRDTVRTFIAERVHVRQVTSAKAQL